MSKDEVRRFNQLGISEFEIWLDQKTIGGIPGGPPDFLRDPKLTEPVAGARNLGVVEHRTRLDLGAAVFRALRDIPSRSLDSDSGIWSWLSAAHAHLLMKRKGNQSAIGERARWFVSSDYRKYYRHLIRGPWQLVQAHSDEPTRLLAILHADCSSPGDLYEQIASRPRLVRENTYLELATRLYFDPDSESIRRGARSGEGSSRRLQDFMSQIDLTCGTFEAAPDEILSWLPAEFRPYRDAHVESADRLESYRSSLRERLAEVQASRSISSD